MFILFFVLIFWYWRKSLAEVPLADDNRTAQGAPLELLVADTPARQTLGLGKRDSLAPYDGMIFILGVSDRYGFVMRGMRFPIDIVWLSDGVVVDIAPSVPIEPGVPEADLRVYYPRLKANTVIELPAGWAEGHGLKIGDELKGT